jgi:hypothetical protein
MGFAAMFKISQTLFCPRVISDLGEVLLFVY